MKVVVNVDVVSTFILVMPGTKADICRHLAAYDSRSCMYVMHHA